MPLSSTTLELLARLAQQYGQKAAPVPFAPNGLVDLSRPDELVALDEPHVRAALEHEGAAHAPDPRAMLCALLCERLGDKPVAFAATREDALAQLLAARPGRVVAVGGALAFAGAHPGLERVPFESSSAARFAGAALVAFEPDVAGLLRLKHLELAAHEAGCAVVLDGTRRAFRTGATLLPGANGVTSDYALFGPSIAGGLPLHAIVGLAGGVEPDAASCAAACAVLRALRAEPPKEDVESTVARLGEAILRAADSQDVRVALEGPPSMPSLVFAGQEDAPGSLIAEHFARELESAGVRLDGPILLPASLRLDAAAFDATCRAFAHAFVRIRALLVEYNSYLSGGLPWPFRTGSHALRTRGLTFYRYPRRAEVDVGANGEAMRIAFGKSELGPVTSSGFFVPTRIEGDATLTIRYVLRKWHAGPDSACLGLFLQNEASTARYYAQIISLDDAPTTRSAAAGFGGEAVGKRVVEGDEGWLQLARKGAQVIASWRASTKSPWIELARCEATRDVLIAGCKIWSKEQTDGLVADLFDLEIEGALAKEQPELLPPRPDPRLA